MRLSIYDLVIQALLGAILLAVQVALAPLPNIELVSLLCLVYTWSTEKKRCCRSILSSSWKGLSTDLGYGGSCTSMSGQFCGASPMLLRRNCSVLLWCLVLGFYGLSFGALCAIPYLFAGGAGAALAWWISGIPFDIAHCLGNAVSVLVLYKPLYYLMEKLADFQRRRERLRSK